MRSIIACLLLVVSTIAEPPVDNRYLPPGQGPPSTSYGVPGRGRPTAAIFGARQNNGGSRRPSTQYGPPSSQIRTPSNQYGTPSNQIRTPSNQYGTPSNQIRTPSNQYGAPSNQISTPSNQYGAPSNQIRSPSNQYGVPSQSGSISSSVAQNRGSFGTPSSQYGAPVNGVPSSQYGAPSSQYGAPSSQYGAPSSQYGAPDAEIRQPTAQFGAPGARGFSRQQAPSQEYGAPVFGGNGGSGYNGGEQSRQYLPPGEAGYGGAAGYGGDDGNGEPANYSFEYMVKDEPSGNDFGHRESRQGDRAEGLYYVLLPDGRKQTVEYEADQEGYKPKISYEDTGAGAGYGGPENGGPGGPY